VFIKNYTKELGVLLEHPYLGTVIWCLSATMIAFLMFSWQPPRRSLVGYKHVVDVEYCPPIPSDGAHFAPEVAKAKEAAQNEPTIQNTVEYYELVEGITHRRSHENFVPSSSYSFVDIIVVNSANETIPFFDNRGDDPWVTASRMEEG